MKKYIFISFFILIIFLLGNKKELYTVEKCEAEQNIYHQAVLKLENECSRISLVTKMIEYYDCSSYYNKKTSDVYTIKTMNSELYTYNIPKEHVTFNKEYNFFYTNNFPIKTKDVSNQENFSYNEFINDISFSMTLKNKNENLIQQISQSEYQSCLINLKNKEPVLIKSFYGIPY